MYNIGLIQGCIYKSMNIYWVWLQLEGVVKTEIKISNK